MPSNDNMLYKVLAVVAVVAIVAIAVVIVGPSLLSGANGVAKGTGQVVGTVGNAVSSGADQVAGAVADVARPKGASPAIAGVNGVISMVKNDPLYDGSPIEAVAEGNWFEDKAINDDLKSWYGDLVVLKYHGQWLYFGNAGGNFKLVGFTVTNSIETRLFPGETPIVTSDNDPPLTSIKILFGHNP